MNTPENITELKENEIFVFGSNLAGNHAGGAAKLAKEKFGAGEGIGEGLRGNSYAFPTLTSEMEPRTDYGLIRSTQFLKDAAKKNPGKIFFLTKVGCGIAGYSEEYMSGFFKKMPKNIIKPLNW